VADAAQDIRTQTIAILDKIGIAVEARHHAVATGGRDEINMRFAGMTHMADNLMIYKYVVENVARRHGATVSFTPPPPFGEGGAGMRVHQSIWLGDRPLFAGDGYAGSSALMRHYIAGLLEHAPALLAICAPDAHSYRRPAPGSPAPVGLGYLPRGHAAAHRIPIYSSNPQTKRVEFRCPGLPCNPYLAFAAMLMAGIDGFQNRLYNADPDEPIDQPVDALSPPGRTRFASPPSSFEQTFHALEADHAFLLKGEVFTPEVIETCLGCHRPR
jgi:glutamine synthetase